MTLQLPVRKQTLRLALGILALIIPLVLTLTTFLLSKDYWMFTSLTINLHTGLRVLAMVLCLMFSLIFIAYAIAYTKGRSELMTAAVLLLMIVVIPFTGTYANTWFPYVPQIFFVAFLAVLGWLIRHTFNLPLAFPALTKIAKAIWVLDALLLVYIILLQSLWPPLGFLLETIILWLFSAGIFIRHQINKKLGG